MGKTLANYPKLFDNGLGEGEQADGETFTGHWGWVVALDNITNGDRSKWDYYFEMGAVDFLNYLSFVKDKQENLKEMYEKEKRKHGIK